MDAGAMALLYDAVSGAERRPPAVERSCTPHDRAPARAAPMDINVGRLESFHGLPAGQAESTTFVQLSRLCLKMS